ncbi:MAG: hypothetical protein U0Q15_17350 [Kineosporiaceae bacterium]
MFITSRTRRWRRAAALTAAALALPALAAVGPASTASAGTIIPCGARSTATPFRAWGDTRNYYPLQGGTFEGGAPGWSLYGNTAVTSGNEPWKVWGGGSGSLRVGPSATAVSPSFCVDPKEPFVRFFYKGPGVSTANLKVSVTVWRGSYTNTVQFWANGASTAWQVSPAVNIPNVADSSTTSTVSVKFEAVNSATAVWLVDDLSVDPWKSL